MSKKANKSIARWALNIIRVPWIIATALLGASYLACYIPPSSGYIWQIAGLFFPLALIAQFIFLILWLIVRSPASWISILSLLPGITVWPSYFSLGAGKTDKKSDITLISYNAQFFTSFERGKLRLDTDQLQQLAQIIQRDSVDIVCLQELRNQNWSSITAALPLKNNLRVPPAAPAILSSQVLDPLDAQTWNNALNGYVIADLKIGSDKIRLINVHLQSSRLRSKDVATLSGAELDEEETYKSLWHSLRRYGMSASIREQEITELLQLIQLSPYPVIVAGDFNEVPMSWVSAQMRSVLTDSYAVAGRGLSATLKSLSGLRIDYIYTSEEIEPLLCRVIRLSGSDHYPVQLEARMR